MKEIEDDGIPRELLRISYKLVKMSQTLCPTSVYQLMNLIWSLYRSVGAASDC